MGILFSTLGLFLFGSIALGTKVKGSITDNIYEQEKSIYVENYNTARRELISRDLEDLVKKYLLNPKHSIQNLLPYEYQNIGQGKDVALTFDQKVDLIMSKFGRISSKTFGGFSHLGNGECIQHETFDNYQISILVLNNIVNNLFHANNKIYHFGANGRNYLFPGDCSGGLFFGQPIVLADTLFKRAPEEIYVRSKPMTEYMMNPITLEDLMQ